MENYYNLTPMKKISKLKKLKAIISLGQVLTTLLMISIYSKIFMFIRIVDPYMAKSLGYWVILSILNFIRDYEGYGHNKLRKFTNQEIV